MESCLARIKSNHTKKFDKDYPFEIFLEAEDKAYFTEMRATEGRLGEPSNPNICYHNGMRIVLRPCINRVNLSELRKQGKEMGVKGLYEMRTAELEAVVNNF